MTTSTGPFGPSFPMRARILLEPDEPSAGAVAEAAGGTGSVTEPAEPPPSGGQSAASMLDEAHQSVMAEHEAAKPGPKPKPENEETPADDAENDEPPEPESDDEGDAPPEGGQPEPEAEAKPDAEAAKAPQGDPLTPEEQVLLKRQGIESEADLAVWTAMTVEQRNAALRPARLAQAKLDRLYGLSPEEREKAISQERQHSAQPQVRESEAAKIVRTRLSPDQKVVDDFAKANGLAPESVQSLVEHLTGKQAQYLTELETERQSRRQDESAARFATAQTEARASLSKTFPKLAKDDEFKAVFEDPRAVAIFQANVHSGQDVGPALLDALSTVAHRRYAPDIATTTRRAVVQDARSARRTAEPTRSPKSGVPGAPKPPSAPLNFEDAHKEVWSGQG